MAAQEEATMTILYEASMRGCVSTLIALIQQNPLILDKISLTTFSETPVHVSALRGHLDFTKTILTHKPHLAKELDSCRRTPLHLASAEGHKEIVDVLLQAYADACLVHDQDGRIPVHYATIRGRTEVVRELIKAKPDSLRIPCEGNTLMHLCVTYNRLETLKVVVEEEGETSDLLNFGDSDGKNTILHLATMLKQVETIRYMLSIPKIIEAANNKNDMGFTALDIIEHTPKDFKSLEIQLMLTDSGIRSKKNVQPSPAPEVISPNCCTKFKNCMKYLFEHEANWMEKRRETLGLVATVISTMSFQVAINPPGGVYQEINEKWKEQQSVCTTVKIGRDSGSFCPGKALLGTEMPNQYRDFLLFNTISFVASVSVTMLLLTGVPIKNRFAMWMLIISMCITITFLLLAYYRGIMMTTPYSMWIEDTKRYGDIVFIFLATIWFVVTFVSTRLAAWLQSKSINGIKSMMSRTPSNMEISMIRST